MILVFPRRQPGRTTANGSSRFACWGRKRSYNEPKATRPKDNKAGDHRTAKPKNMERNVMTTTYRTPVFRSLLGATALGLSLGAVLAACGPALAADPIKIGVI